MRRVDEESPTPTTPRIPKGMRLVVRVPLWFIGKHFLRGNEVTIKMRMPGLYNWQEINHAQIGSCIDVGGNGVPPGMIKNDETHLPQ
jgi:hypothetical protein